MHTSGALFTAAPAPYVTCRSSSTTSPQRALSTPTSALCAQRASDASPALLRRRLLPTPPPKRLHAAGLGCGGELGSIATGLGCDGELGSIATGFLRQYPASGMLENPGAVTIAMGTEVAESDQARRTAETFGQRTSIYRGVTRHRWTGRHEAHLWDKTELCRRVLLFLCELSRPVSACQGALKQDVDARLCD